MLGAFSISPDLASAMRSSLLLTSLFFLGVAESFAGCEGTMMGATSEDPLLSSVDLTFSPIYSSATTSGTSNCPNWDIALQERFARWQFLVANQAMLEEEIATGHGPHSEALGALYYCSEVGQQQFGNFLRLHQERIDFHLNSTGQVEALVPVLSQWIQSHPSLRHECKVG